MTDLPTIYRIYGQDEDLLYIGTSKRPVERLDYHRKTAWWWLQVARIAVEHFDTLEEALLAERRAIRDERPEFNTRWKAPEGSHPLRHLREAALLSVEELAAQVGCSARLIRFYEAGANVPGLLVGARIATALDVSLEEIAACFQDEPDRT